MISAQDLLSHAEDLVSPRRPGALPHVNFRRAISAAYYGVFHQLLTDAADSLVGKTKRSEPGYGIVYRAFEHRRMRDRASRAINLSEKLRASLGIQSFSSSIREGAAAFVELQTERHKADYDPAYRPNLETARAQIGVARDAIADFASAPKGEYQLFLLLLLFDPRD